MHAPEGAEILRREQLEMKAGSPLRTLSRIGLGFF